MNEQKATSQSSIEWTRIINPDGTVRRGYTWNPIGGCKHACEWIMPNGQKAECYAKTVAERMAQKAYSQGFEHHYWRPEQLDAPRKLREPAGIFLDSMSDLMGHWVPDEQINAVLDVARETPQHIYMLLTKNAPRLHWFTFPDNVWVGASSPPDYMWGKQLSRWQQARMLDFTLRTLQRVRASVKWMSFEPLSWDVSELVQRNSGALDWAVIGAASNGKQQFPPSELDLRQLLKHLDQQRVPVFYKGNLRSLPYAAANWRENFPTFSTPPPDDASAPMQLRLF